MKINTPLELIQKELNSLKRALIKSDELFKNGEISKELNDLHRSNLLPNIEDYKKAINCLESMIFIMYFVIT